MSVGKLRFRRLRCDGDMFEFRSAYPASRPLWEFVRESVRCARLCVRITIDLDCDLEFLRVMDWACSYRSLWNYIRICTTDL